MTMHACIPPPSVGGGGQPVRAAFLTTCAQICSLMRGGIAERGGVRVGHRIIEINGQSVVATPHEKIVQILSNAMGEVGGATNVPLSLR